MIRMRNTISPDNGMWTQITHRYFKAAERERDGARTTTIWLDVYSHDKGTASLKSTAFDRSNLLISVDTIPRCPRYPSVCHINYWRPLRLFSPAMVRLFNVVWKETIKKIECTLICTRRLWLLSCHFSFQSHRQSCFPKEGISGWKIFCTALG